MRLVLFLELCVIFACSFLLTVQLFYNCLNEGHFLIIGILGIGTAIFALWRGYDPSGTTVALYFFLALAAFGYLLYTLGIGYIVYDFGPDQRAVFIEKEIRSQLANLPKYAERSKDKFGGYQYVCRHEAFAFVPAAIDVAYEKESCYGPLAFLIFDTGRPEPYSQYRCEANDESWFVETNDPGNENTLCIDTRRKVVENSAPVEGAYDCR